MRIDCHTHIFPPQIQTARERFFAAEPTFKLLYDSPKARLATAEDLLELMDREEVDKAVVFGFPWEQQHLAARHNDYVLEAAARYPDRLIPFGCVNPRHEDSAREAEKCLHAGAKGLGEIAIYGACDTAAALQSFADLIHCCRSHHAPLLVHANEPVGHWYPGKAPLGLDFYYALARAATGIPLILAHWGGGLCFYELLRKEAPEVLEGVYYDTAASPFLYRPDIYAQMARSLPGHKILFGSDYPLLPPSRYFREMSAAGLTTPEIAAISGQNAARLLGLSE